MILKRQAASKQLLPAHVGCLGGSQGGPPLAAVCGGPAPLQQLPPRAPSCPVSSGSTQQKRGAAALCQPEGSDADDAAKEEGQGGR